MNHIPLSRGLAKITKTVSGVKVLTGLWQIRIHPLEKSHEIPEEIVAGILKRICQLQIQKGKRDLAGAKWAFPRVSFREKWILLPDTLRKADNYGLMIIIYLARKLDLELREIPYEGKKIRDLTTRQEKFCIGLLCSLSDFERKINITEKKNPTENARTFFRAQQVVHGFGTKRNLGSEALRRNQK